MSCVGRHTTITFMPFAARLAIIKVPQGQSAIALAARSSEQVVLGSAGLRWAAVFSGQLRPLRSEQLGSLQFAVERLEPTTLKRQN